MARNEFSRQVEPLDRPAPEEIHRRGPRIKNILCPVGFSEFSLRAFNYASSIARHFGARLFLQHSVPLSFLETAVGSPESHPAALQKAQLELEHLVSKARDEQLELPAVVTVLNEGEVRDRILETVEKHEIDLLVMGTHGRKGLDRLVHGSLTERIVHEVLCPVLVVSRPQHDFITPEETEPVHLKTLLLPTDFSPASGRALAYGLNWAAEWSGKVILFHAVEKTSHALKGIVDLLPEDNPYFEQELAGSWEKIRAQVSGTAPKQCEITYEVRHGNPKEQILKIAAEIKPDLIVMGARGPGKSAGAWGSTISAVVRDGRFPVLGVRELAA